MESVTKAFAALAFLLLGACTQYRYIHPETPQGQQCVAELDANVNACEQRAKDSAEGQRVLDEAQRNSYQTCTHQFSSSASNPDPCSGLKPSGVVSVQNNTCREGYTDKFIACGGRLEEIKDK